MPTLHSIVLVAAFIAALSPLPAAAKPATVSVMADRSLNVAITEIARSYARKAGTVVNTSYQPPQVQQEQITEGAAADIVITPLLQWIEELKTQGLVDVYSLTPVAKNRMALVGPVDSTLQASWDEHFPTAAIIQSMHGEPGFAVGNPAILPEGSYARETLHSLGVADDLEPYTLYVKQLEQMFEVVGKQGGYGLFFYSSVLGRSDVRIIELVPENLHRPIQYYAVVVAGENMEKARKFLEYLKSPAAQQIFRDNGL